jgi:ABC-type multidrug transport system ATPase subunit
MSSAPAIHVGNLRKTYGSTHMLNGVNLEVDQGEFYALMGPNGSGKSTLAAIIASVVDFDSGTVEVFGHRQAEHLLWNRSEFRALAIASFGYIQPAVGAVCWRPST